MKYPKEQLGACAVFALLGAVAIAVGLLWPSFYWLVIGIIIVTAALMLAVCPLFDKRDSDNNCTGTIGCSFVLLIAIISGLNLFFHGTRYIVSGNDYQHRYNDCSIIKGKEEIKEVSRLEGFFHLCFLECKVCKERRVTEKKQHKTETKIKQLQEEISDLQELIDIRKEQIDALRNGADIDTMVFEELYEEEEEYDDSEYELLHLRPDF